MTAKLFNGPNVIDQRQRQPATQRGGGQRCDRCGETMSRKGLICGVCKVRVVANLVKQGIAVNCRGLDCENKTANGGGFCGACIETIERKQVPA
jgi:hypothetical protein